MPEPYYADELATFYLGDSVEVLAGLPDASVDAVCTDPPYGLGFMGHEWDQPGEYGALRGNGRRQPMHPRDRARGADSTAATAGSYDLSPQANARFGAWCEEWARECLRLLKPGGHLFAFGGSRTWHRLAAAVEDAGFEIRDSIAWLYGSGFPKSLDVSKAIDKAAGAERAVIGQRDRYRDGSRRQNLGDRNEVYGQGLTANGVADVTAPATDDAQRWQGWGTALKPAFEPVVVARKPLASTVAANVLEHGTGALNIDACRIATDDVLTGSGTPPLRFQGANARPFHEDAEPRGVTQHDAGRWPANVLLDESQAAELDRQTGVLTSGYMRPEVDRATRQGDAYGQFAARTATETYGDTGGASRFFPTFRYEAKAPASERPRDSDGTAHPTVKPLDLMRWLVRLGTPPRRGSARPVPRVRHHRRGLPDRGIPLHRHRTRPRLHASRGRPHQQTHRARPIRRGHRMTRPTPPPLDYAYPHCGICGETVDHETDVGFICRPCSVVWPEERVGSVPGEWQLDDAAQCKSVDGRFLRGGCYAGHTPDPTERRCWLHDGHPGEHIHVDTSSWTRHHCWIGKGAATSEQLDWARAAALEPADGATS